MVGDTMPAMFEAGRDETEHAAIGPRRRHRAHNQVARRHRHAGAEARGRHHQHQSERVEVNQADQHAHARRHCRQSGAERRHGRLEAGRANGFPISRTIGWIKEARRAGTLRASLSVSRGTVACRQGVSDRHNHDHSSELAGQVDGLIRESLCQ
jgi:hypothetical protein